MELNKEKIVAYCLIGILFLVGVVCYAAFPNQRPEQPLRVMLSNTAGNVLFDMKMHASIDGYGIECIDCHHEMEEKTSIPLACGAADCHDPVKSEDTLKRSDAFHLQCIECHKDDGTAPEKCESCHFM